MSMHGIGFLAGAMVIASATLAIAAPETPPAPADPPVITVPADVLARYAGRYRVTPDVEATITADGDHLYGGLAGRPVHELFATSPTHFFARDADAEVTFQLGADGRPTAALLKINGQDLPAPREDGAAAPSAPMP